MADKEQESRDRIERQERERKLADLKRIQDLQRELDKRHKSGSN